ncbi:MAG: hypothetical protein LH610_00730 [Sphingomonas bacterium]|nr:hypothetical protein [Sphingomonas bacterium]
MKLHHLFLNRWMALLWSAGVAWLALDIAGPDQSAVGNDQAVVTDITGAEVSNEQVDQVESLIANL